MRKSAALTLVLAALSVGACNDDNDSDTAPADQPAPAQEQAPSSGSEIAPDEQGREEGDPAE